MDLRGLKTPCYIFNEDEFQNNIENFQIRMDKYFSHSIIGYSFKTNSLPYLVAKAREMGCYAETVSDTEYQLAKRIGYEPQKIIFNGPAKGKAQFCQAFCDGSIINIDSARELEWLKALSNKKNRGKIGVRVNMNLEKILPGQTAMGEDGGRFGFCDENGKLSEVIRYIQQMDGVKLAGLHMHVSSKSKSVEVYRELTRRACEIARREALELEYIDIGGGFFGGGDDGTAYESYIKVIHQVLKEYQMEEMTIIVEPGASVVATAIDYLTEVLDIKKTDCNCFVITDGSRLHLDPFFHKNTYIYEILGKRGERCHRQVICGYTCMENDRLMTLTDEQEVLQTDRILYRIVGSYTMALQPLFIEYFPTVYTKKKNEYELIREKWGINEYLQKNKWEVIE